MAIALVLDYVSPIGEAGSAAPNPDVSAKAPISTSFVFRMNGLEPLLLGIC